MGREEKPKCETAPGSLCLYDTRKTVASRRDLLQEETTMNKIVPLIAATVFSLGAIDLLTGLTTEPQQSTAKGGWYMMGVDNQCVPGSLPGMIAFLQENDLFYMQQNYVTHDGDIIASGLYVLIPNRAPMMILFYPDQAICEANIPSGEKEQKAEVEKYQ